jgi:glycosyltransferase involved in cell wall biosynthesis
MNKTSMLSIFCIFFVCFSIFNKTVELPITIIIPSYNNIRWCEQNLISIFQQNYNNYTIIYIDDCSTDGTSEKVKNLITLYNQSNRFQLIENGFNKGALCNIYEAVHTCPNNTIIALVDGDDWLVNAEVLNKINSIYSNKEKEIWLTYGQFIEAPHGNNHYGAIGFCKPISEEVIKNNSFRKEKKLPSHLRTFKAGLFKAIQKTDLLYENTFFAMTWDMAMMFPMIEMAAERHYCFREPLYAYNLCNPISDWRKNGSLQAHLEHVIRNKEPYERLEKLSFF